MNPVSPEPPIGPRRSWRVLATSARNTWRTPAVGPDPAWSDPAGGPTVGWHVPTSMAARTWQVPATSQPGRWRGTTGPVELPEATPAARDRATTQTTWCAPVPRGPGVDVDARAKLVGPVRTRGCVVRDLDELTDALRALRFQELARVLERKLSPETTRDDPDPKEPQMEVPPVARSSDPSPAREDATPPLMEPAAGPPAEPVQTMSSHPSPPVEHPGPPSTDAETDEAPEVEAPSDPPSPPPRRRRLAPGAGVVRGREHGDREGFLAEAQRHLTRPGDLVLPPDDVAAPAVPRPVYTTLDTGDLLGSFRRAVEWSGGRYHHVVGDLPDSLLDVLVSELDAWEIVVTGDPELHELSSRLANRGVEVGPATPERAVAAGMGVTSAVAGIAATGSLVLDSRRDKGRLAALLPPVHLCVVPVERLVATPSDVVRALSDEPGSLPPSLMLVTGPSRATNLERLLTVGTPGPTALHVVVVEPHPDL